MANPFNNSAPHTTNIEQKRRERFKLSVYSGLGGLALLLVGILIQGCHSERRAEAPGPDVGDAPTNLFSTESNSAPVATLEPNTNTVVPATNAALTTASVLQPAVSNAVPLTAAAAQPASTAASGKPGKYVIKRGDTLLRIARAHHTTVKALKLANGLTTDRILVGQALKLPAAGTAATASQGQS